MNTDKRKTYLWHFIYEIGIHHSSCFVEIKQVRLGYSVNSKMIFGILVFCVIAHTMLSSYFNPLSVKLTKWPNILKQFVGNLPTNCLSVFGHFVGVAPKGLNIVWNSDDVKITNYGRIPWNENWPEDLKFLNSQNLSEVYFIQQIFFYELVYKYESFSGP